MGKRTRPLEDRRPPADRATPPEAAAPGPLVVTLDDPCAGEPELTGAKAAALARAGRQGLPVLPGAVLTTVASAGATGAASDQAALRQAWKSLSGNGRRPVVVRSSSTAEDGDTSSMAGMFTSVLDVEGWDALCAAVGVVLRSAGEHPMAVLVQPMLDAATGGVLFGLDPVTGRADRLVVEAVDGGPSPLVSGLVAGTRHVLTRRGRLLEADTGEDATLLGRRHRRALADLAAATARAFGRAQDVEWAFDRAGRVWLLQSRPVTASGVAPSGPLLGPGPVAETFPDPLSPLELDLWIEPLRAGVTEALRVVGVTARRTLAASPVVTTVGGRVAADLGLLDAPRPPTSWLRRLDPRPPARRLGAAWRVGRLGRALPSLAEDVCATVDADLAAVPPPAALTDEDLLDLVARCRVALRAVHGHEVLAGILARHLEEDSLTTSGSLALAAVAAGRIAGLDDADIVADEPVTLALVPPAIGGRTALPAVGGPTARPNSPMGALGPREALRLRARWLQELSGRAAHELGQRLSAAGRLADPSVVGALRLPELGALVEGGPPPGDLAQRCALRPGPPLPVAFRLTPDGAVVAEDSRRGRRLQGRGAGGGRGMGRVHDRGSPGPPAPGAVLVVQTLEPGLAASLPGLAGLVAETGSVLSHLAILARELGVPTVVGVDDALRRYPAGVTLVVDGTTGEVARVDGEQPGVAPSQEHA